MTGIDQMGRQELQDNLMRLIAECPAEHCNLADCPLSRARKLAPDQRLEWFDALSLNDLSYLAAYHYICMAEKLDFYRWLNSIPELV